MSKPDLKHPVTFFRKLACDLGFAACQHQMLFNDSEMLFNEFEMLCL